MPVAGFAVTAEEVGRLVAVGEEAGDERGLQAVGREAVVLAVF